MAGQPETWVPGIRVGHYTDTEAVTGCTVVLCEKGAVGGVDVRGSAPGTRETDLLHPTSRSTRVHGVALSGGSSFGLDSATGVVRYLEERGVGVEFGGVRIPIVTGAILFDLAVGDGDIRPGADEGYKACEAAVEGPIAEGNVGAGTGATVGKLLGRDRAVKGGLGVSRLDLDDGTIVGAIVAVNAMGSIYDLDTGDLVAGPLDEDGASMLDSLELAVSPPPADRDPPPEGNTTIGVIATNARLDKAQAAKLASVAHDGLAIAVRPAHTMVDGDTLFLLATGEGKRVSDLNRLCAAVVLVVGRAIYRGVAEARGLAGIPGISELSKS